MPTITRLGEKIIKILTHMKRRKTAATRTIIQGRGIGAGDVVVVVWGGMQGAFTHHTFQSGRGVKIMFLNPFKHSS